MNAKIKLAVGLAAVLTGAVFLAARYNGARVLPPDFRDAVKSEGAVGELQNAVPGGQDLSLEIPSPAEPQGDTTPKPGGAADQGVERYYSKNDSWDRRIAEAVGVKYPCYVEVKHLGKAKQLVWKRTYDDGSRKESVVVKRFSDGAFVNQWFMKIATLSSLNYERSARKLFDTHLAMSEKFRKAGLKTLEPVLTDSEKTIMVTKFAKGDDMGVIFRAAVQGDGGAMQWVEKLGAALAAAHRNNFAIGDFNLGNGMIVNGEFCFIDLDRASVGGSKGWDIILPFYHAILLNPVKAESEAWALVAGTFLKGYLAGGGDAVNLKDALRRRYSAHLDSVTLIRGRSHIHAVRREIKKAAGGSLSDESDEELGPAR